MKFRPVCMRCAVRKKRARQTLFRIFIRRVWDIRVGVFDYPGYMNTRGDNPARTRFFLAELFFCGTFFLFNKSFM